MTRIFDLPRADGLTDLDLVVAWDFETSTSKVIEFQKLRDQIIKLTEADKVTPDGVRAILADWFVEHPAVTTDEVTNAIAFAIDTLDQSLPKRISDGTKEYLTTLGWATAPVNQQGIRDIVAQYIIDNQIGQGQSLNQGEVETILVNYITRAGDSLLNTWIEKYLQDNPPPAQPTKADIEKIIYDYASAHPEVFPGAGSGSGTGADNATIQAQIAAYFNANPINVGDALTSASVKTIVTQYLKDNPQPGRYDDDGIKQLVADWVADNPNAYKSGFTQPQVETIISNWLSQHPEAIVMPDNVQINSPVRAEVADDLSAERWIGKTFYALKGAVNYPDVLTVDAGAVITDCFFTDPATNNRGRVQFAVSSEGFAYRYQAPGAAFSTWGMVDFKDAGGGADAGTIESAVQSYLGQHPPSGAIREASSWAVLRTMEPTKDGERVWLSSYNQVSTKNGPGFGFFVGRKVARADDGGFTCSALGAAYHWLRADKVEDLDITHFGARIDGVTDDSQAVLAMFTFLKSAAAKDFCKQADFLPIRLPAGDIMINPIDLSKSGVPFKADEIRDARKKEAWRRLGVNVNPNNPTVTNPNGAVVTRWQDVDETLGARNSEQENPNDTQPINNISFYAPWVGYGKLPVTRIISNKLNDSWVFLVNARYVVMRGIQFDGQITQRAASSGWGPSDGSTKPSNNQGFIKNYAWAGQYWNVQQFMASYVGGETFTTRDSLDALFSQVYSNQCWGAVIYSGWTGAIQGNWDHATAMEVSNCNFQRSLAMPPLYLPRMSQAIIRNVWIEHCVCPADLTDWQGTIDTFCVEDCKGPVHAWGSRPICQVYSNPTGVPFDTDTQPTIVQNGVNVANPAWFSYPKFPDGTAPNVKQGSGYEAGRIFMKNTGLRMTGSLEAGFFSTGRCCNPFNEERWVKIGKLEGFSANNGLIERLLKAEGLDADIATVRSEFRQGTQSEIRIMSSRLQSSGVVDGKSPMQSGSPGCTILRLNQYSNAGSRTGVTWHDEGDPAVLDVAVARYLGNIIIWVKLPPRTREVGYIVISGGVNRFDAGQCTNWIDGNNQITTVNKGESGSEIPSQKWSVRTKKAGISLTDDGRIGLKTVAPTKIPTSITTAAGYLSIYVDEKEYALPYFGIPA